MTDRNLSPRAQAVLDAYWKSPWDPFLQHEDRYAIAAALRAAADQVVPEHRENYPNTLDERYRKMSVFDIRNRILAIAAELEDK
jgi:hypothetical protein